MGERRRDASYWVVGAGIAAALAVGLVTGARVGSFALAAALAVAAVVRGVWPGQGPEALVVRRRWLDVTVLGALAVALVVLAVIVPARA